MISRVIRVCRNDDTSQFAVECIEKWWRSEGQKRGRKHLLELTLQRRNPPCMKHGIQHKVQRARVWTSRSHTIHQVPSGTQSSRLFSEIKNWAGRPLDSYETILNFIRTTKTKTGLKVNARLVKKQWASKSRPCDALLNIKKIKNYTLRPSKNGK